jgi:hypothetical protein
VTIAPVAEAVAVLERLSARAGRARGHNDAVAGPHAPGQHQDPCLRGDCPATQPVPRPSQRAVRITFGASHSIRSR